MFKKIASNTIAQLVAKFFGAGLTLLTTFFTIRLAGLDLYGDLTKILVLVAIGFTTIDFGLNAEGIRSATKKNSMEGVLKHIIYTRLLISLVVAFVLNLIIYALPGGYSPEVKSIFWLGSLAIIFQGIYSSSNAWFQYNLSYWRSTISVGVGSLMGTILTLYFLYSSPTLSNLVLANTFGYLIIALTSWVLLPKLDYSTPSKSEIITLLRRSLILGSILIASVLAGKIDTIILGVYRSSAEVGQYGFAYRIFDVVLVFPVFVMNAIYPLTLQVIAKQTGKNLIKHTLMVMAGTGIVGGIVLWYCAPLISLIKPGMELSISVLRTLSYSLPLFYLTAPLMWSLISQRRDKVVLLIYLFAGLINGTLNLFYVPRYGVHSAAIITGITELFILTSLSCAKLGLPAKTT